MSWIPRLVLALIAGLFGVMMIAIAPPTDKAIFFHGFGGFCLAIAIACVTRGRTAEFFGSLVALVVIGLGVWYIGSMFLEGPLLSGRRSEPSLLNALLYMGFFGVPGATYIYRARFGLRGHRAIEDETGKQDEP